MKISKITKLKDGMYKLKLDEKQELKVHEDLILKYNILTKKELNEETKELLTEENKIYEIYNVALKYIKIRIRSIKELETYLKKKQFDVDKTQEAIAILKKQGYLNNDIYVKALINDKIRLSNDGPLKIKEILRSNDIAENIITEALTIFDEDLEIDRIKKLIDKQVRRNHNHSTMMLKNKIKQNLINLGYHSNLINSELNKLSTNDRELYKKEYDKIYNKLSRKYQGKDLEYRIKQKLYQKGFSNYEE